MKIDWSKLSSISEIVSSIAILVTLVYLAVQTQQNTDAINSQSRHGLFEAGQQEFEMWLDHPDLTLLIASNELDATPEQMVLIDNILVLALSRRDFAWRQYRAGILDEESWEAELGIISLIVGTERSRDWWRNVGRSQFSDQFVQIVDSTITNQPYHPYWINLNKWVSKPKPLLTDSEAL